MPNIFDENEVQSYSLETAGATLDREVGTAFTQCFPNIMRNSSNSHILPPPSLTVESSVCRNIEKSMISSRLIGFRFDDYFLLRNAINFSTMAVLPLHCLLYVVLTNLLPVISHYRTWTRIHQSSQ